MIHRLSLNLSLSLCLFGLVACASHAPAPVVDLAPPAAAAKATVAPAAAAPSAVPSAVPNTEIKPGFYVVKKGDTLYSIALDHGQSYRDVAAWNSLEDANRIQIGQQLRVTPPDAAAAAPVAVTRPVTSAGSVEARPLGAAGSAATVVTQNTDTLKREPRGGKLPYSEQALAQLQKADLPTPVATPATNQAAPPAPAAKPAETRPAEKPAVAATVAEDRLDWAWPNPGKVTAGFVEGGNKGVDIAAKSGEAVLAVGDGKIAYVGTGMRGYGKMVIVKHNAAFLSVYAHNSQIVVKEGQTVAKGQKIAEVGSTDTDQPKLHFEIRRQGKPVDPLRYLPAR
jgi:lipoprotein NlpD